MVGLIEQLKARCSEFDFFQAVMLLEEYFGRRDKEPLNSGKIAFSSEKSIVFPPGDIASFTADKNGTVHFKLSFMGLVGVSSPLPHYFTEYAMQQEEDTALADFLDIFNHRIYVLFYRAWEKYRLLNRIPGQNNLDLYSDLAYLTGLDRETINKQRTMLAYTGILAGICRSAEGLKTILSDFFGGIPVSVKQWIGRWAKVENLKKLGVNATLGSNAMLGNYIHDFGGKFRVILGPLEKETFEKFLPQKQNISLMKKIITEYLTDPLEFDIEVRLKPSSLTPVVLGKSSTQLGVTASCGVSSEKSGVYSVFIEN